MNNLLPPLVEETNLSRAWARVFIHILDNPGSETTPLLVSLSNFTDGEPEEDEGLRSALDASLKAKDQQEVHTVANTIFPKSLWRLAKYNRHSLYEMYLDTLPRYKALAPTKNNRGMYFERLIAFGDGPMNGNQLEFIITEFNARTGVRRSLLQAAIFKPGEDHVRSAQLGFPCLQHVSFVPNADKKELTINAFYATQQIFQKAYGNYLGICRLGHFVATEMGLKLSKVNCFAGVEKLEGVAQSDVVLKPLISAARRLLH